LKISVDGKPIIQKFLMFSRSTSTQYQFKVGKEEQHEVMIEEVARFNTGVRKHTCRVFVDGALLQEY
jgi:hypothetical protein